MLLLITVLHICTSIKNVDNNQVLDFHDKKKDEVKLGDALPQKILENQKITHSKDCI